MLRFAWLYRRQPRKPQNNLTEFDRKSISEAIEKSGIKEVE